MSWFAAHIVMVVHKKNQRQKRFPAWENIVLIEADSLDVAFAKAEQIGRREEGDDDGTFRWGEQLARWQFAGVRKVTRCVIERERPGDGDEISFSELELDSASAVKQFVAGEPTNVRIQDRYDDCDTKPVVKAEQLAQRKPA